MPPAPVRIMMNVGNPDRAFSFAGLPHKGVGLARLEFIINRMIGVHPRALLEFDRLDTDLKATIRQQMAGYADPVSFFVAKLAEGVAQIAAAFAPEPVIVRLSDFKSNEYANLIGGRAYEPHEENPMLGFRGASRYVDPAFQPCFELECRALRHVREAMGLTNVQVMVPFVRTVDEGKAVVDLLARNGLKRGDQGLKVLMMCELPTNALLAEAVPRALRRHVDRLERHDAADAGRRPRLGDRRAAVRRTRRGGEGAAGHGDRRVPQGRQVRGHLRPGAVRITRTSPRGSWARASTASR